MLINEKSIIFFQTPDMNWKEHCQNCHFKRVPRILMLLLWHRIILASDANESLYQKIFVFSILRRNPCKACTHMTIMVVFHVYWRPYVSFRNRPYEVSIGFGIRCWKSTSSSTRTICFKYRDYCNIFRVFSTLSWYDINKLQLLCLPKNTYYNLSFVHPEKDGWFRDCYHLI